MTKCEHSAQGWVTIAPCGERAVASYAWGCQEEGCDHVFEPEENAEVDDTVMLDD